MKTFVSFYANAMGFNCFFRLNRHDIFRLQITMHQAMLVSVLQAEGRLADDLAGVGDHVVVAVGQHLALVGQPG